MQRLIAAAIGLCVLSGCQSEPEAIALGTVDAASFEERTGTTWPLTVDGGELFCQPQEASMGEQFMIWIVVDGTNYALNPTARFLLDDGTAENWEAIWRRDEDADRYHSLDGFEDYITDECTEA